MSKNTHIILFFTLLCYPLDAQTTIRAFGSTIFFTKPDTIFWKLVEQKPPEHGSKGVEMYKHTPIKDSKNRPIEPVIAIIYEEVLDSIDVTEYSVGILGEKTFKLKYDLLGGYPIYSSSTQSVVFKAEYNREGVQHKINLGYILDNHVGIEIVGDATEETYPKVESDIKKFLKSVVVK